ncbi:hypothetical protein RchiOBHm_Chr3g0465681 [Rosa chinensis]|uniref:Uncharacterized protein n=1 Tax=Rosa chinensis TaxID=74649 RepID=A0A2P6R9S5_ROSCH|nr:hypothetical protein RchiOBHm_Chr3g0465681 [Rosa chinensis]
MDTGTIRTRKMSDAIVVYGGILEVANLSLDKPELEGVIFDDEDELQLRRLISSC